MQKNPQHVNAEDFLFEEGFLFIAAEAAGEGCPAGRAVRFS